MPGFEHAEHIVAGAAIRADRGVGGVHVRRAAGVLQRTGTRGAEELRERAVHDVDIAGELREQLAGVDSDEDIDGGQRARVDTGEPQQGASG